MSLLWTTAAGYIDLYHRTSPEAADAIMRDRRFDTEKVDPDDPNEKPVSWFADTPNKTMYGPSTIHVRVPKAVADTDSIRGHYVVYNDDIKPEHIIGRTDD